MCYQISVFALYRDRAGQVASVRGYSRAEGKPQLRPLRAFLSPLKLSFNTRSYVLQPRQPGPRCTQHRGRTASWFHGKRSLPTTKGAASPRTACTCRRRTGRKPRPSTVGTRQRTRRRRLGRTRGWEREMPSESSVSEGSPGQPVRRGGGQQQDLASPFAATAARQQERVFRASRSCQVILNENYPIFPHFWSFFVVFFFNINYFLKS